MSKEVILPIDGRWRKYGISLSGGDHCRRGENQGQKDGWSIYLLLPLFLLDDTAASCLTEDWQRDWLCTLTSWGLEQQREICQEIRSRRARKLGTEAAGLFRIQSFLLPLISLS